MKSGPYRLLAIAFSIVLTLLLVQVLQPRAAQAADFCGVGETPQFRFGFAHLKSLLGDVMGAPLECEHANPENGDTLQQTTTGLSFYRRATNTPTFTDGWNHWAWTLEGLVTWTGSAVDPPGTAEPTSLPTPSPTPPPVTGGDPPVAYIDEPGSLVSASQGSILRFRGRGVSPLGLAITGYSWGFNGRQASGESSFNWQVNESGTMTLKVRDSRGVWSDSAATVTLQMPAPTPTPTATPTPRPPTPTPTLTLPSTSVIETCINGTFLGWDGYTVFPLCNGQVWEQAEYSYRYRYAYRPDVTIVYTSSGYLMFVEGMSDSISVKRVTNFIRTCIAGTFVGWDGDTVFPLCNGQVWGQVQYSYTYHYAYRPDVLIYQSRLGGYRMKVDGIAATIRVVRLSY